jgi:hypothetical protein
VHCNHSHGNFFGLRDTPRLASSKTYKPLILGNIISEFPYFYLRIPESGVLLACSLASGMTVANQFTIDAGTEAVLPQPRVKLKLESWAAFDLGVMEQPSDAVIEISNPLTGKEPIALRLSLHTR